MESEKKRREMSAVYNSYRAARSEYSIDQIPLPDSGDGECVCVCVCVYVCVCDPLI